MTVLAASLLGALALVAGPPAAGGPAEGPQPPPGKKLRASDLVRVYTAWWHSPYEYMFSGEPPTVRMRGREYGMFQAGVSGILDYGGLPAAFSSVVLRSPPGRFGDRSALERVSGLKLLKRKKASSRSDFDRYDPDIVRWGAAYLVPDPRIKLLGLEAQTLYDRVFQRFFRLMAASRLHLVGAGDWDVHRGAYLEAMKAPTFDGIDWLEQRFAGVLGDYAPASIGGSPMTPAMALGFWLRRAEDGTADALWEGLVKLLSRYDKAWLAEQGVDR